MTQATWNRWLWLGGALALTACARPAIPVPDIARPAAASGPRIVVIKSDDNPIFHVPVRSFVDASQAGVAVFTGVLGTDDESLLAAVRKQRPDLLFVLGTKATLFAVENFQDTPVLFALVVNYKRHGLDRHPNVMGIALEIPPANEFAQFKMVAPGMRRVLTFYVERESAGLVARAQTELHDLGIDLVAVAVTSAADVEARYDEHAKGVDGIYFLNDPVVMNRRTFEFLRDRSRRDRLPFFSSLSDQFARAGAVMSISTDLNALGPQAASMVSLLLEQRQKVPDIGIQPPISSNLVVNLGAAEAIGMEIPAEVMPFLSTVGAQ
jgi:putative ABC transport system substrate-binding protein